MVIDIIAYALTTRDQKSLDRLGRQSTLTAQRKNPSHTGELNKAPTI